MIKERERERPPPSIVSCCRCIALIKSPMPCPPKGLRAAGPYLYLSRTADRRGGSIAATRKIPSQPATLCMGRVYRREDFDWPFALGRAIWYRWSVLFFFSWLGDGYFRVRVVRAVVSMVANRGCGGGCLGCKVASAVAGYCDSDDFTEASGRVISFYCYEMSWVLYILVFVLPVILWIRGQNCVEKLTGMRSSHNMNFPPRFLTDDLLATLSFFRKKYYNLCKI